MADDRDLAGLVPGAPPPRPDRRAAAIDAAVARFGGETAPVRPASARRRRTRYGPQIGAVAAAVLVVTIGLPIWQSGRIETPPARQPAPVAADRAADAPHPPTVVARPGAAPSAAAPAVVAAVPAPAARADAAEEPEAPAASAPARPGAPPPPVVIQSVTTPPPLYPPPPPPPAPAMAPPSQVAAMPAGEDVVVTGARVARTREPVRRDWARCTVDDPRRALAECRARFGLATPGVKGRAQALTGDGVLRAWHGDRAGARAALDRAIAVAPTADAFLNRALLRMEASDDTGALADLDRAVRRNPSDARGYHYRGIVQARLGDPDRAAADARRAAALDPAGR